MFDKHYHTKNVSEVSEVTKNITVQEHRATTDESLKLLDEMRNKVIKNIVAAMEVKDNYLNAVVLYYQDDVVSDKLKYAFDFSLNGQKYQGEGAVDKMSFHYSKHGGLGSYEVRKIIYDMVADEVAKVLLRRMDNKINPGTGN